MTERFFPLRTSKLIVDTVLDGTLRQIELWSHGKIAELKEDELSFLGALVATDWAVVMDDGSFYIHREIRSRVEGDNSPLLISLMYAFLSDTADGDGDYFSPLLLPDFSTARFQDYNLEKARTIQRLADTYNELEEKTHVFWFEKDEQGNNTLKSRRMNEPSQSNLVNELMNIPDESKVECPLYMDTKTRASIEQQDIRFMELMDLLPEARPSRLAQVG